MVPFEFANFHGIATSMFLIMDYLLGYLLVRYAGVLLRKQNEEKEELKISSLACLDDGGSSIGFDALNSCRSCWLI